MDELGHTGFEIDQNVGRERRSARDSMFLQAEIEIVDGEPATSVRVRNISAGGLMVEGKLPLTAGMPVSISLRGIGRVGGRVAWIESERAGIAFDRPIDPKRTRKPVTKTARPQEAVTLRRSGLRVG